MNTSEAATLARSLMFAHGLDRWTFQFDNGLNRFGRCIHGKNMITLSEHLTRANTADRVRQTILHEIAHALVGPGAGHGPVWQRKAREIGVLDVSARFSAATTAIPQGRYELSCATCGNKAHIHRMTEKTKRSACGVCCKKLNGGRFDARFKWTIRDLGFNPNRVKVSS